MSESKEGQYRAICVFCARIFHPKVKSTLWWKAKRKAEKEGLTTIYIFGEGCNCLTKKDLADLNAPYHVYGYDMTKNVFFDFPFLKMTEAVKKFIELDPYTSDVHIKGFSPKVQDQLLRFPLIRKCGSA